MEKINWKIGDRFFSNGFEEYKKRFSDDYLSSLKSEDGKPFEWCPNDFIVESINENNGELYLVTKGLYHHEMSKCIRQPMETK
jgi:hypothetical protein